MSRCCCKIFVQVGRALQTPSVASCLFILVLAIRIVSAFTNALIILIRRSGYEWYWYDNSTTPTTIPPDAPTLPWSTEVDCNDLEDATGHPGGCLPHAHTEIPYIVDLVWWEVIPTLYLLDCLAAIFGLVLAVIIFVFCMKGSKRLRTCKMWPRLLVSLFFDCIVLVCYILGFFNIMSIDVFYIAASCILLLSMLFSINLIICSKRMLNKSRRTGPPEPNNIYQSSPSHGSPVRPSHASSP
uniref:Uncharacterized protein n=1 Tax=Lygus hesperus TaxID=30085 RepID=A0A0K8SUB5_LYGHE